MTREVIFAPEALTDLFELYDYIAADSGAEPAHGYTDRIVATCRNLVTRSRSGARCRDDLRPGCACHDLSPPCHHRPTTSPTRWWSSTAFSMAGGICRRCSPRMTMAEPDRVAVGPGYAAERRRSDHRAGPCLAAGAAVRADTTCGTALRRVLHRADQQRPHPPVVSECHATFPARQLAQAHGLAQLADVQRPFHAGSVRERAAEASSRHPR